MSDAANIVRPASTVPGAVITRSAVAYGVVVVRQVETGAEGPPGPPGDDPRFVATDGRTYSFKTTDPDIDPDTAVFDIDSITGEIVTPDSVPMAATQFVRYLDPSTGWVLTVSAGDGKLFHGWDISLIHYLWSLTPVMEVGDSTAGYPTIKTYDATYAAMLGRRVVNAATSGDRQVWIDARIGGRPARVTVTSGRDGLGTSGTIPATGSCNVTLNVELGATAANPYTVMIAGIRGTFVPTELPGSPDPLAASDAGSVAFNYNTGVFTRDLPGIDTLVADNSVLQTRLDYRTGLEYRRLWGLPDQPSRHDFFRRYQNCTVTGTGGTLKLGRLDGTISAAVTWNPTAPTPIAVTYAASGDLVTFGSAHGAAVGDPIQFDVNPTTSPASNPGAIFYIKTIPTGTTATLSATPGGATLDITANGSGNTATTATTVFAGKLTTALAAMSGFSGLTVSVLTGLPGQSATAGQVQINWAAADTPSPLVVANNSLTGGGTITLGNYRTGVDDTIDGIASHLANMTDDARAHTIITDLAPFPGEEIGTAKRVLLDEGNDAIAECFPMNYFPLWTLMRNLALITALGYTPMTNGSPTTLNDDAYAISQRMTPPTFLDQGGGTFTGGHPGPAGAVARAYLLAGLHEALGIKWKAAT